MPDLRERTLHAGCSPAADGAEAVMFWASNELINGHDDGTIDTAGLGTRAQAASIIINFDKNVGK